MTRLRRYCPAGMPAHIIQRGNNRVDCFMSDHDRATYMRYLGEASIKFDVAVHAWVLMSNHVHLLLTPSHSESASRLMQFIGRHYVRFFNRKYSRTGTLWEGRFKSSLIQAEDYFLTCQRYIELNPVRAGMVCHPGDYHWSSYKPNALGIESAIRQPHEIYLALGNSEKARLATYRGLFSEVISEKQLKQIRFTANKGLVLGSRAFTEMIERNSGQRARLLKPGPKVAEKA